MKTQYQVAGSLISSRDAAIRAAIESWAGSTPASEWTEDQIREHLPGWCKAPEGVDQTELDAEVIQTAIAMMHAHAAELAGNLAKALPHGVSVEDCIITTLAELAAEYDINIDIADIGDAPTYLLPGWYADDGNAEVYFATAESGRAAAREYVESGDWGERNKTIWIYVKVYRKALGVGKDGDIVWIRIDEQWHRITFDPNEPACADGQTHDWRGRDVRGHGGGVLITEICVHCARYRIVDTWAQCRDTGEQGLKAIEYRKPDESSREWVEARRLEAD